MTVVAVTGTDTGVGKTVVTAALAVIAGESRSVAVYKPVQTGTIDGDRDIAEVQRLSGVLSVHEGARLPDPLAPVAAARRAGCSLPRLHAHVEKVRELSETHEVILVEGSGGLLVSLTEEGEGLAELATALGAAVVVVARAGLGTLNHTALTAEALTARGCSVPGVVIGAWPENPDLAMRCNRDDLAPVTGLPLLGAVPDGASTLTAEEFSAQAPTWIHANGWLQ